jgi:t-SNARE complex subunit (syntaxin)
MKENPERIEREVENLRERMEPTVAELDRRRHHMTAKAARVKRAAPKVLQIAMFVVGVIQVVRAVKKVRARGRAIVS